MFKGTLKSGERLVVIKLIIVELGTIRFLDVINLLAHKEKHISNNQIN